MRVKITFEHPRTKNQEKHLISVPEHLKNISDLQFHIIEKLCLGSYLQRGQFSTALTIGGYNLPKKEKIIVSGCKRRNERLLDDPEAQIHERDEPGENEMYRDSQFLNLIRDVNLLKELYTKVKRVKTSGQNFEHDLLEENYINEIRPNSKGRKATNGQQGGGRTDEGSIVQVVVNEHRHKHNTEFDIESESGSESEGEAPHIIVTKQNLHQKNAISQAGRKTTSEIRPQKINSLLGEETIRPKPKLISKPVTGRPQKKEETSSSEEETPIKRNNVLKAQGINSLLGTESNRAKPKLISKPDNKKAQAKEETSSSEESEEEEQPVVKEKKITTTLNIPTPADEFNKKKETWDRLPVATQWGAKQKEKKEKKPQRDNNRQQEKPHQESKDSLAYQGASKPNTTPTKAQAQVGQNNNTNNQKAQPVPTQTQQTMEPQQTSSVDNQSAKPSGAQAQQVTKPQQTSSANKQGTKPPVGQASQVGTQQNQNNSHRQSQNRQAYGKANNNVHHNRHGNQNEQQPFFKMPIYDPDLFHLNFDAGKTSGGKNNFNGFTQVPVSKLEEKWKKETVMLLKVDDVIKYKCTTLSKEVMEPVLSDWREGKIENITKNKVSVHRSDIKPREAGEEITDEEDDNEETEEDEFFLHTLNSIYVSDKSLDQERKAVIQSLLQEEKKAVAKEKEDFIEKKRQVQEELQRQLEKSEEEAIKDEKDYKKRMIGKQINYYYSDKNYPKDAFIKAHADKDPERYMSISLLLNFPKIRSMTQDVNVVRDAIKYVLSTDSSCNYEIDESETRIKKRIL